MKQKTQMSTSLRGLWVVRIPRRPSKVQQSPSSTAVEQKGLLFKRFGTVESRVRGAHGASYVPVPTDASEFCRLFAEVIAPRISTSARSYVQEHGESSNNSSNGKCRRDEVEDEVVPLRKVCALSTGLWPVCWIERDDVYHVAVPSVSKYSFERKTTSDEL